MPYGCIIVLEKKRPAAGFPLAAGQNCLFLTKPSSSFLDVRIGIQYFVYLPDDSPRSVEVCILCTVEHAIV
jgi:hypothetical protein